MQSTSLLDDVFDLEPGDHICLLSQTEEEHSSVISSFLRWGLERGDKLLYVTDTSTPESLFRNLNRSLTQAEYYQSLGQLIIARIPDAYMQRGRFDPDRFVAYLHSETETALSEGYRALRVASEMSWVLQHVRDTKELIRHEAALNDFYSNNKCLAICQYDMRLCKPGLLLDVIATHPRIVVGTDIIQNYYYIPPRDFQYRDKDAVRLEYYLRNLTEHKRVEDALRENREQYRRIVETTDEGVCVVDEANKVAFVNTRMIEMLGYRSDEVLDHPVRLFVDPEMSGIAETNLDERRQGIKGQYDLKLRRKDGTSMWALVTANPIVDRQGKYNGSLALITDISRRREVEDELETEKKRLAVTLESIGDGVISTDTEGRIHFMNKIAERITGYKREEAIGEPIERLFRIIKEDSRQPCEDPVKRTLRSGLVAVLPRDTVLIARDGTERLIADSSAPIVTRGGRTIGVVVVFRDVTKTRKIEDELIRSQKLESVGILAGGIAHDFNNILTALLGNIELAKNSATSSEEVIAGLKHAEIAGQRARELAQQLLTFAQGGAPIRKPTDISRLLREVVTLALTGSKVRCEFEFADDLWCVQVDQGQMSQVFSNLIINANQAMPEGGIIRIRAENIVLSAAQEIPLEAGGYVKVSVQDQGVGIHQDILAKIFDPYFTTKMKGRGLGLATVYSIVNRHEGYISAQSAPGVGTTFFIYLPVSEEEAAELDSMPRELPKGKGRVLFMDDEAIIRDTVSRMLIHMGYEVILAKDGEETIENYVRAKNMEEPIDVVIMDLTVPGGMGGKESIKPLLEIEPGVKVIASSGYSKDPVMANYRAYGFVDALSKPYFMREIAEILQRVIGEKEEDQ